MGETKDEEKAGRFVWEEGDVIIVSRGDGGEGEEVEPPEEEDEAEEPEQKVAVAWLHKRAGDWDPEKHPRLPEGEKGGGQFTSREHAAPADSPENRERRAGAEPSEGWRGRLEGPLPKRPGRKVNPKKLVPPKDENGEPMRFSSHAELVDEVMYGGKPMQMAQPYYGDRDLDARYTIKSDERYHPKTGMTEAGRFEAMDSALSVLRERLPKGKPIPPDAIIEAAQADPEGPFALYLKGVPEGEKRSAAALLPIRQEIARETIRLVAEARRVEPHYTQIEKDVAEATGARMEGLAFAVKTEKSTGRKIEDEWNEAHGGLTAREVAKSVPDSVRYTFTFEADDYKGGVQRAMSMLSKAGFSFTKFSNTWPTPGQSPLPEYVSINTQAKGPDGSWVEIQFHTPESFNVKEYANHHYYELARLRTTPDNDVLRANRVMRANVLRFVKPVANAWEIHPPTKMLGGGKMKRQWFLNDTSEEVQHYRRTFPKRR